MRITIDVDAELWAKFRAKVHHSDKTLGEVVPQVLEPALRQYLDPPEVLWRPSNYKASENPPTELPIIDRITPLKHAPPPTATRRCELCDNPTERLFSYQAYKVCYSCWKKGIISLEPTPPAAD